MSEALDSDYDSTGLVLRLIGRLRSGWRDGPHGPFFYGRSKLAWKSLEPTAELWLKVKQKTADRLELAESISWNYRDTATALAWKLQDGALYVSVPLLGTLDGTVVVNPAIAAKRGGGAGLDETVRVGPDPMWFDARVRIVFPVEAGPGRLEWERGNGMASAGLPSLGRRR